MSAAYGLHRAVFLKRNGLATMFEDRRRTWAEPAERLTARGGAASANGSAAAPTRFGVIRNRPTRLA